MKDKYNSFSELSVGRPKSFKINHNTRKSTFLIFTPHGGGIEPGTTELCEWFGDNSFSYYTFSGIGRNCKDLHITSTSFDEPKLTKLLSHHKYAISFHGMTNYMKQKYNADIFLGGLNKMLINSIEKKLNANGFSVATSNHFTNSSLAASIKNNVTNKCSSGQGAQIELSENLRKTFFTGNLKFKTGRKQSTKRFDKFCNLIKEVVDSYNTKKGL